MTPSSFSIIHLLDTGIYRCYRITEMDDCKGFAYGEDYNGGEIVKKRKMECIRLDPEEAICPEFDSTGIKLSALPEEKMGIRVQDDCAQEHIQ